MNLLNKRYMRWIVFLAIILGLSAVLPGQVKALPQRAITLLYFRGFGLDNAVLLEWATATEFETAGFIIKRANSQNGQYVELDDIGFIPGEGDGIIGAEYDTIDDVNVVNGQTYWYILVEIENSGAQNPSDPISVTAGEPTPTPSPTPTTQPTTNSQSTATAMPSKTPTPTRTPQTTSQSATPVPANTAVSQQPTATSQSNSPTQQPAATATTATTQTNNGGNGGTNIVEASSPTDPYPAAGSPSPTFVPDPSQANESQTEPYPVPGQETEGVQQEGYIAPTEVNSDANETPAIQPQGNNEPRGLSTQPPLNQQGNEEAETAEPGSSSAIFLWIGFAAAFLIFVGGVIGSIFLFTRRSNQK